MDVWEEYHLQREHDSTAWLSARNYSSSSSNDSDLMMMETEVLLLDQLGPKQVPYASLIPMTCIYVLIFVTGMVGNGATCIVIAKNAYMQSATNYYLFNLAVADMLTLTLGKVHSRY